MKKGFTLIELLVVVLIIGILSAVALPQYTKAVEKSRATEAVTLLGNLLTAEQIYKMGNGSFTTDLTLLDLQLPGVGTTTTASTTTKNFRLTVSTPTAGTLLAVAQRGTVSGSTFTPSTSTDTQYTINASIDANGNIFRWCETAVPTAVLTADKTTGASSICKSIANGNAGGMIK